MYKIGCLPQLDTNDPDEVSHRCLLVFWRAVREVCDELAERNAGSDASAAVITSCYGLASSPVTHTRVHTNESFPPPLGPNQTAGDLEVRK